MSANLERTNISRRFLDELINYCTSNRMVEKVILFGSRARGDYRPGSDIDLAIHTNHATHSQQNLIESDIQEMSTHLKIDIVFWDRLTKTGLISNIEREGVVVYGQGKALREA